MPKKAPKNAFYYFMQDFKEEQRKKGVQYENLMEVSKAADPAWRVATPQVRARFEAIAKQQRDKRNIPLGKLTSTGIPVAVIEQQQKEIEEAIEYEIQDIKNLVKTKAINDSILEEDFYLIDINYYCKASTKYVIGESTVLRFNLRKGIIDYYHEMINPGRIPIGYASDVKIGSEELGLDMPDEFEKKSDYMTILANIIDYLKKDKNVKIVPPLFTMPDKVEPVQDFILQLCSTTGEDEYVFRVYRLDTLFFHLINAIKTRKDEGFPKESLALVQLKKDPFKYTPDLGCEHHEAKEKPMDCTTSRTKRWAYTICDSCCPVVGIEVVPGSHVPMEYDVEAILQYKDMKKERAGPTIAGFAPASSSCNSTTNDSFNESHFNSTGSTVAEGVRKEKRTHAPLRMPQADYSKNIRPAPELTDEDFPTLSMGAGRGRGLGGSFSRMNLRK